MIRSLFLNNEPLVELVRQFVSLLNVKITNKTVEESILSHPDYPSLLTISDCLSNWNIKNAGLKITKDIIDSIPLPCITVVNDEFKVVTKVSNEKIEYLTTNNKRKYVERNVFFEAWSGVVLLTEAEGNAGEQGYIAKKREENNRLLPLLATALLGCLIIITTISFFLISVPLSLAIPLSGLFLCKSIGVIVSALLIWYEIDRYNRLCCMAMLVAF
ncbi:MAG: cysteine peptidase family C39 domain-containing protein [Spirosomataceae bacterium]